MRLKDKIALVTGSSQGIGRAIAVRFAQEGADVVINYNRTAKGAEEALAEVEAAGRRGLIVKADLGNVEDIRRLINQGVKHFGRLDILVNNAGLETHAPFWEVSEEDYDKVLNVNLKGIFFATQEFVRHLRATEWYFASAANRDEFAKNPEKYAPQFGGYCAWAVGNGYTASIDPAAWKIVDGKLYLNYSKDVQKKWEQDIPGWIKKGNENWPRLIKK